MKAYGVLTSFGNLRRLRFFTRRMLLVCAVGLLVLSACLGLGVMMSQPYVGTAMHHLDQAIPVLKPMDHTLVHTWRSHDVEHVQSLAKEWPWSIPRLLGETVLLSYHRHQLLLTAEKTERGYSVLSAARGGKAFIISASVKDRLHALVNRSPMDLASSHVFEYRDYTVSIQSGAKPAHPDDVTSILNAVPVPDEVLADYSIILLPFVLEGTAALGEKGKAIIGAAPSDTSIVSRHRTAYALLHELGHHIHMKYLGTYSTADTDLSRDHQALNVRNYLRLRGIDQWTSSGPAGSDVWYFSAEETFAEDFRILFGTPEARVIPHGTAYGDPREAPDGGRALWRFMADLISSPTQTSSNL